jgi:hypothetical protein
MSLSQIRWRKRLHNRRPILEPRSEDAIRILEHTILQTDDNELTALETCFDQPANVLRMRQIQRGIDFVQDVHGRGFELEKCHNKGEGDK